MIEIISLIINLLAVGLGYFIAGAQNKKLNIETRQKEMLNRRMDQFYEKLEDMELDIQKGSMEFNKAIWTPYSIQIRLYSLQRIVIKTYGNKGSRKFNLSVIKLINLIYELMVKLDESDLDDKRRYSYDSSQIFTLEKTLSDCFDMILELQIDINKM